MVSEATQGVIKSTHGYVKRLKPLVKDYLPTRNIDQWLNTLEAVDAGCEQLSSEDNLQLQETLKRVVSMLSTCKRGKLDSESAGYNIRLDKFAIDRIMGATR